MGIMANEEEVMYLENLEEYIYDEDKVVTYKWLSRTLSVHVNQAKQMLYTFVDVQRKKKAPDQLSVVYLLAGVTQEEDVTVHKIQLIPEPSLDGAKSRLHPVTSCHVYSVQKAALKDSNALYMADVDLQQAEILNANKCSAIKCMSAKIRSQETMDSLRPAIEKPTACTTQPAKTSAQNGTSSKTTNKGGVAGMFAKAQQNTTKRSNTLSQGCASGDDKTQSSMQTSKSKSNPKSGGLQSFFGKQESKPKCATKPAGGSMAETDTTKPNSKNIAWKECSAQNRKKKVLDSDEEDPLPQQQKRRRIRPVSESSSSEEDVELESPVPSPPPAREPTPPRSPSPLPVQPDKAENGDKTGAGEKHRGRKKKLVSKNSVNEEGYMVTEKVWEYESMSESDEEKGAIKSDVASKDVQNVKKAVAASKPTSPPCKASRKQMSLMSFFKKK
ncbi:DNA polymerase delta subunit 3 [Lamellibrachia satsuma]|nr:DNA polymerase delta subunit 3 [Lamellibrachia satsuma]